MYNETGNVCFLCKKGLACKKHPLGKKNLMQSDVITRKVKKIKEDNDEESSDMERRDPLPWAMNQTKRSDG